MRLLVVREVAQMLRVSVEHVRRLIRHGHLPAFKVGGRGGYRIKASDLDAYVETASRQGFKNLMKGRKDRHESPEEAA